MLWFHIAAGLLALTAGFIALYAQKGGTTHRAFGRVFGGAMLAMTTSAFLIAALSSPSPGNIVAALVTLYLVGTGWLAVRLPLPQARPWLVALSALGLAGGLFGVAMGAIAWQAPSRSMGGIPAVAILVFGTVPLLGVAGDARLLARGSLEDPARLLRHLWRMQLALWIATTSFFFGQADEFPATIRQSGLLPVPVVLVTLTFLYWVARQALAVQRARRRLPATGSPAGASVG